jgi:polyhydroxyalkanoate synthesis regulator phasin
MSDIKDDIMKAAMKALQNEKVQKFMSNEKVQKGMAEAFKAGYELKSQIDDTKQDVLESLNVATSDDLREMKRELDRLRRQVSRLEKEQRERKRQERADDISRDSSDDSDSEEE